MVIETDRLFLREMNENDFGQLFKVLGDPEIMQYYPYTFDEARVQEWIRTNVERYRVFGFGLWAVCLKETGEMIGDCGLSMQKINGFIRPEIGYHIRKDQQKKGYAKEAAAAVRDWAFANTPFKILYSYMKAGNTASRKTAESIGMKLTGTYMDSDGETAVYAVSKHAGQMERNSFH